MKRAAILLILFLGLTPVHHAAAVPGEANPDSDEIHREIQEKHGRPPKDFKTKKAELQKELTDKIAEIQKEVVELKKRTRTSPSRRHAVQRVETDLQLLEEQVVKVNVTTEKNWDLVRLDVNNAIDKVNKSLTVAKSRIY